MPAHARPAPAASPRARGPLPTRRCWLRGSAAIALGALGAPGLLTGCGPVRPGGPEEYTPPPPGIDDLYRTDLLALLDRAEAGVDALAGSAPGAADPEAVADLLSALADALAVQRLGLLTGAERERELEAVRDPDPRRDPSSPPLDAPEDLTALVALLAELRDLGAMAARQVSGSLARPCGAVAAHAQWAALGLVAAGGRGQVPPTPSAAEIEPTREVPQTDPPSIGAEVDHHRAVEDAQEQEWYAGYLQEVLAAHTDDEAGRESHLTAAERHRRRARVLGEEAEADGAPVVSRKAVHALPGGAADELVAEDLVTELAQGLLVTHLTVVGSAPFDRRATSIAAALEEATVHSSLGAPLAALPSLAPEDEILELRSARQQEGG